MLRGTLALLKEEGAFYDDLFDGEWHYFDKRGFPVGESFDKAKRNFNSL